MLESKSTAKSTQPKKENAYCCYQLQTSSRQRIRTEAVVCSSHVRQRSFRVFSKRLPFTMLVYSWFCGIFYLITSLLWKNEYLKWNFWHSIVFCLMYFVTICLVCINQNILESKKSFIKWCLDIVKGVFIFCIIAILFGAPPIQRLLDTVAWAILMSLLCCLPSASMLDVYHMKQLPPTSVLIVGSTLLGSWLGAFVVPLDWEKSWQIWEVRLPNSILQLYYVWPIPCSFGAVVGHLAGVTLKLLIDGQTTQTKSAKSL